MANQIKQAFDEPPPNGKGADEWVDSIYVISPYECSTAAIESVKTALQRSGQIVFACGQVLLELFAKHWPEFLWFESTVLVSYLSALRKNVESDYALANLILQKSAYLEASSSSSFDLYVEPTFYRELRLHRLTIQELLTIRFLTGPRYLSEIQDEASAARRVDRLLHAAMNGVAELKSDKSRGRDLDKVTKGMLELWESSYRRRVAELRAHAAKSGGSGQGFAVSGAFTTDAFISPKRSEISVDLKASAEFTARAEAVTTAADAAVTQLRAETIAAGQFAGGSAAASPLAALASSDFLGCCKIAEVAEIIPEAFAVGEPLNTLTFDENLLDRFDGCLMMTGAAGFGKTAFCRWHAIRDANRLVAKQAFVLPVYRALHPLSSGKLGSFEEAFFANEELRKLIQQQSAGQAPFTRIRLYLDGLDEVTSHERQCEILKLAAEGVQKWKFLQIVVTGRDHVSGADLRWLPRIRLCELSDAQIRVLAERWLGRDRLDGFFQRLIGVGTLSDLMKVPLLATLILAVFRKTGSVPPNKTNLYSLFVELLCGGWDFYKNNYGNNLAPAFNWDSGYPGVNAYTTPNPSQADSKSGALYWYPNGGRLGYTQSWNFNIQRELPYKMVLDVGYVGTKGTALEANGLGIQNQLPPAALSLGSLLNGTATSQAGLPAAAVAMGARYPYGNTGQSVAVWQTLTPYPQLLNGSTVAAWNAPLGFSTYNALQVQLNKQYTNGVSWIANYTFSKSISNVTNLYSGGTGSPMIATDLALQKSISSYDQPQVVKIGISYDLPVGKGKRFGANLNPLLNNVLGGWKLQYIGNYSSGTPLAFAANSPDSSTNLSTNRAQLTNPAGVGLGVPFNSSTFNAALVGVKWTPLSRPNLARNKLTPDGSESVCF